MINFLFRLLARLPLSWLHALGCLLGWLVLVVAPSYRRQLRANLELAGLGGRSAMLRAAAESGKSVLELPYVWFRPKPDVFARTTVTGWDDVEAARARGRGILFLTPHLGCFEITAQYFANNAHNPSPLTVLYRPPRKAYLEPVVGGSRARENLKVAPADFSGVRRLLRALRDAEAIGMLPDQVPAKGEGVWANFFGRPAYTMTLPGKLEEQTGAAMMLSWGERLPRGRGWIVHMLPFPGELSGTPEERASMINSVMEDLIRKCPDQYFWGYRRYKTPHGVSPPGGSA